jgi:hypothetical protein
MVALLIFAGWAVLALVGGLFLAIAMGQEAVAKHERGNTRL